MDTKIEINADLNKAIDQLAEKLGVAASEIIPHYTRMMFMAGIANFIAGILVVILPLLLFVVYPQIWESSEIFIGIRLLFCIVMAICGGYKMANWFESVMAPQALAISKLINQIT